MSKKLLLVFVLVLTFSFIPMRSVSAQMMGNITPVMQQNGATPSAQDLQDIQTGQDIYNKFHNKQVNCAQLKDPDFEKIGEYLMNQSFGGNTNAHIQINSAMKQMMGENGEEQMHIRLGKNATGCNTSGQGGVNNMMGSGYSGMMGWNNGFSILPLLIQLVVLVDLILVGVWLWRRIGNKK